VEDSPLAVPLNKRHGYLWPTASFGSADDFVPLESRFWHLQIGEMELRELRLFLKVESRCGIGVFVLKDYVNRLSVVRN